MDKFEFNDALFENVKKVSISVLNYNFDDDIVYMLSRVELKKEEFRQNYIDSINKNYQKLKDEEVEEFNGYNDYSKICYISKNSEVIEDYLKVLIRASKNVDVESKCKDQEKNYNKGILVQVNDTFFISLTKPFRTNKLQYAFDGRQYKKFDESFLVLKDNFDIIIDSYVYFINKGAEKFFNIEKTYNKICDKCLEDVKNKDIIENFDVFEKVAKKGHNPQKFYSFNNEKLKSLSKDKIILKEISEKFGISLNDKNTRFVVDDKSSERLIKILCDKAMTDPFNEKPVEVNYTKIWKK